ncbi:MAG: extracellular solute-binding protein [Bacteroidota bacterium]
MKSSRLVACLIILAFALCVIGMANVAASSVVEITVWDKPDPSDIFSIKRQKEFDEKNPGIKVNHEASPPGDMRQSFMIAMAAGRGPDAWSPPFPFLPIVVGKGYAYPLDEYVPKFPEFKKALPVFREMGTINGKLYGFPMNYYNTLFFYNRKLFREAGLPDRGPKDFKELLSFAKKLKAKFGDDVTPFAMPTQWGDWFMEYPVWANGADFTKANPDGTCKLTFTAKGVVDTLTMFRDWKFKEKIMNPSGLQEFDPMQRLINDGKLAMSYAPSDWFKWVIKIPNADMGVAAPPAGSSGKGYSQLGGQFAIINPKISKAKRDAVMLYIVHMNGIEFQRKLAAQRALDGESHRFVGQVYEDVNPMEFIENPPEWIAVQRATMKNAKPEYYLKDRLSSYLCPVIEKVFTDQKVNIKDELAKAQAQAQKDVVDAFNKEQSAK